MVKNDFKKSFSSHFLRIFFSHSGLILSTLLLVTALVVGISLITPPKYEAVTKILVKGRKVESSIQAKYFSDYPTERLAFLQSQVEIIRSDEVARRVLNKLFPSAKEFSWKEVKSFQQSLKVLSPPGQDISSSDVLLIQITDDNPVRAAETSNRFTEEFLNYTCELKGRSAQQTVDFLEKQSESQLEKLKQAEEQLKNFEGKAVPEWVFLISLVKTRGADTELITFNNNYLKAKTALEETETHLTQLRAMVGKGVVPPKLLRENPTLSAIKETINKLESQLSILRSQYSEFCPKNKQFIKEIERNQQWFNKELKDDIDSRFLDLAGLQARVKSLKGILDHYTALAQKQLEYSRLFKNYEALEEGYQELLRDIQKARVIAAMDVYKLTPIEIIDKARIPKTPVSPNLILNTLIGMLIGALSGWGLAFILDHFDHTLKSAEDVERYLHLPVLGSIPRQ